MQSIAAALLLLTSAQDGDWPPQQLAINASCIAAGFDPSLAEFRQAVLLRNNYNSSYDDTQVFAPVYASFDLDVDADPMAAITRAVIFVHGLAGDANTYFCDGVQSTRSAGVEANVISLAPWFGKDQVEADDWLSNDRREAQRNGVHDDAVSAFWSTSRWLTGGDNSPDPKRYTTSFDVLDTLVNVLIAARESGRFPNLRTITVNGFSAGAQLVSRWALFSPIENARIIVADGSTYLYLNEKRPALSCMSMNDTGVGHSCAAFATPSDDRIAGCDKWNDYKFGIDNLASAASSNIYIGRIVDQGAQALKATIARFLTKDLRFIIGSQDVCNCQSPGYTNSPSFCFPAQTSCSPTIYPGCCDTYPDTTTENAMATVRLFDLFPPPYAAS